MIKWKKPAELETFVKNDANRHIIVKHPDGRVEFMKAFRPIAEDNYEWCELQDLLTPAMGGTPTLPERIEAVIRGKKQILSLCKNCNDTYVDEYSGEFCCAECERDYRSEHQAEYAFYKQRLKISISREGTNEQ